MCACVCVGGGGGRKAHECAHRSMYMYVYLLDVA